MKKRSFGIVRHWILFSVAFTLLIGAWMSTLMPRSSRTTWKNTSKLLLHRHADPYGKLCLKKLGSLFWQSVMPVPDLQISRTHSEGLFLQLAFMGGIPHQQRVLRTGLVTFNGNFIGKLPLSSIPFVVSVGWLLRLFEKMIGTSILSWPKREQMSLTTTLLSAFGLWFADPCPSSGKEGWHQLPSGWKGWKSNGMSISKTLKLVGKLQPRSLSLTVTDTNCDSGIGQLRFSSRTSLLCKKSKMNFAPQRPTDLQDLIRFLLASSMCALQVWPEHIMMSSWNNSFGKQNQFKTKVVRLLWFPNALMRQRLVITEVSCSFPAQRREYTLSCASAPWTFWAPCVLRDN